jgi:hypothetical protein
MRIFILLLCIYALTSCSEKRHDLENLMFLNILVENSYDYFLLNTSHLEMDVLPHKQDVIRLRAYADSLLLIDNDVVTINNDYYKIYLDLAIMLLNKYSSIENKFLNQLSSNQNNSEAYQIKFIEYVVINSIINDFYLPIYDFNLYQILVVPNKKVLKKGEKYTAIIHLTSNNFHAPVGVVVGNDTISERDSTFLAPVFSIITDTKGSITHDAEALIHYRGGYNTIPFKINYFVE